MSCCSPFLANHRLDPQENTSATIPYPTTNQFVVSMPEITGCKTKSTNIPCPALSQIFENRLICAFVSIGFFATNIVGITLL